MLQYPYSEITSTKAGTQITDWVGTHAVWVTVQAVFVSDCWRHSYGYYGFGCIVVCCGVGLALQCACLNFPRAVALLQILPQLRRSL